MKFGRSIDFLLSLLCNCKVLNGVGKHVMNSRKWYIIMMMVLGRGSIGREKKVRCKLFRVEYEVESVEPGFAFGFGDGEPGPLEL